MRKETVENIILTRHNKQDTQTMEVINLIDSFEHMFSGRSTAESKYYLDSKLYRTMDAHAYKGRGTQRQREKEERIADGCRIHIIYQRTLVMTDLSIVNLLQSSFSSSDRFQNHFGSLEGDEIFSSRYSLYQKLKVASLSLFYRYFSGKFNDELHSLAPLFPTITANIRYATFNSKNEYTMYKW